MLQHKVERNILKILHKKYSKDTGAFKVLLWDTDGKAMFNDEVELSLNRTEIKCLKMKH